VNNVRQSGHLDVHTPGYLESAEAKTAPETRVVAAASLVTGCMIADGEPSRDARVWGGDIEARDGTGKST